MAAFRLWISSLGFYLSWCLRSSSFWQPPQSKTLASSSSLGWSGLQGSLNKKGACISCLEQPLSVFFSCSSGRAAASKSQYYVSDMNKVGGLLGWEVEVGVVYRGGDFLLWMLDLDSPDLVLIKHYWYILSWHPLCRIGNEWVSVANRWKKRSLSTIYKDWRLN